MNRYSFILPLFIAASMSLPAAAQQPATPPLDAAGAAEVVTITAKVQAVDLANRTAQLVGPRGRTFTIKVDERVKNLAQVKVGDEVVVKYYEAVALQLTKGSSGLMETQSSTGPMTAPAGAKPGAAEVNRSTMDANVTKVDKKRSMVALQGADGRTVELKVRDPAVMKDVKVGDQVHATYTEAMVIDVVAPPKK